MRNITALDNLDALDERRVISSVRKMFVEFDELSHELRHSEKMKKLIFKSEKVMALIYKSDQGEGEYSTNIDDVHITKLHMTTSVPDNLLGNYYEGKRRREILTCEIYWFGKVRYVFKGGVLNTHIEGTANVEISLAEYRPIGVYPPLGMIVEVDNVKAWNIF